MNRARWEPPGTHYIDIDYYPEFFAGSFPRDYADLVAIYGTSVVTANGTGPWTAVNHYENLCASFAAAQTEHDWTNLLTTAAVLAHYLEDLHNPMHLATNYDGQFTGQWGMHRNYESLLIENRVQRGFMLTTNQQDCAYILSLQDAIFDRIEIVYPFNSTLLSADLKATAAVGDRTSTNYFQALWDDGCSSFTPIVMQQAAGMVASAWYSAWREAGFPQPHGVEPSRPVIRIVGLSAESCVLSVRGDAGQKLNLETSSDLTNWTATVSFTNYTGTVDITTAAGEGARFFRAMLHP